MQDCVARRPKQEVRLARDGVAIDANPKCKYEHVPDLHSIQSLVEGIIPDSGVWKGEKVYMQLKVSIASSVGKGPLAETPLRLDQDTSFNSP